MKKNQTSKTENARYSIGNRQTVLTCKEARKMYADRRAFSTATTTATTTTTINRATINLQQKRAVRRSAHYHYIELIKRVDCLCLPAPTTYSAPKNSVYSASAYSITKIERNRTIIEKQFVNRGNGGAFKRWFDDIPRKRDLTAREYAVQPTYSATCTPRVDNAYSLIEWTRLLVNSALKTVYSKARGTASEYTLYHLRANITNDTKAANDYTRVYSDSADLMQEAATALVECGLTENATYTRADLEKIGALKAAYKAINHIIYAERAKEARARAFDNSEFDDNGNCIATDYLRAISFFPTYDRIDTEDARKLIELLKRVLTANEWFVLRAVTLEGKSSKAVSEARGISEAAVSKTLKRAREKALLAIYQPNNI